MAKVTLNNGLIVDALTLVKANLRDYMEHSESMMKKAESLTQHKKDLIKLHNMMYFLSLDLENLPIREYKQKK
jgi:hypothetical protein